MFDSFDNVKAVFGFDDLAQLAGLQGEGCLVEFGGVRVAAKASEVAAAFAGCGIARIAARQFREVRAGLQLLQKVSRLRPPPGYLFGDRAVELRLIARAFRFELAADLQTAGVD